MGIPFKILGTRLGTGRGHPLVCHDRRTIDAKTERRLGARFNGMDGLSVDGVLDGREFATSRNLEFLPRYGIRAMRLPRARVGTITTTAPQNEVRHQLK